MIFGALFIVWMVRIHTDALSATRSSRTQSGADCVIATEKVGLATEKMCRTHAHDVQGASGSFAFLMPSQYARIAEKTR